MIPAPYQMFAKHASPLSTLCKIKYKRQENCMCICIQKTHSREYYQANDRLNKKGIRNSASGATNENNMHLNPLNKESWNKFYIARNACRYSTFNTCAYQ